jgi:hypothetical protein
MGRTFAGGMKVYDDSSAGVNGHPNKDRHQVFVGTHAGPIDSFEQFMFDYSVISFSGAQLHDVTGRDRLLRRRRRLPVAERGSAIVRTRA